MLNLILQLYLIIKNMISIRYQLRVYFLVNFNFAFYDYDPNTNRYKSPVCNLFAVKFNILNIRQITVSAYCRGLLARSPFYPPRSTRRYKMHHFPPSVDYPSNPVEMNISDVVKCYKDSNPFSNAMTINVNVMEQ